MQVLAYVLSMIVNFESLLEILLNLLYFLQLIFFHQLVPSVILYINVYVYVRMGI